MKGGDEIKRNNNWIITGASVKGANHARRDLPNQDAVGWEIKDGNLVAAISDGHGSLKHFRSAIGSRLAVKAALEVMLREVDVENLTTATLKKIKNRVKEKLPQRIINSWRDKVREHYQNNLFSLDARAQTKLEQLEEEKGIKKRKLIEDNYIKAYGATLLITLVTERFSLYFKLGDGDITVLSQDKQRLFTSQENLGPATDSLCMSEAINKVKISVVPFSKEQPLFILLSTDGYINSFRNEEGYLKVIDDFIDLTIEHGIEYINHNLVDWLKETSRQGSGDDITLALIYYKDLLKEK
ncbi:MAG: PP2C family serine/threonine-protein phosphatase [Halanaerobacter sp.]